MNLKLVIDGTSGIRAGRLTHGRAIVTVAAQGIGRATRAAGHTNGAKGSTRSTVNEDIAKGHKGPSENHSLGQRAFRGEARLDQIGDQAAGGRRVENVEGAKWGPSTSSTMKKTTRAGTHSRPFVESTPQTWGPGVIRESNLSRLLPVHVKGGSYLRRCSVRTDHGKSFRLALSDLGEKRKRSNEIKRVTEKCNGGGSWKDEGRDINSRWE